MFGNTPWPCHLFAVATRLYYPPSISCIFEFNQSTPWTFYPPHIPTYTTFAVSYHSLASYFLLYMSFLLYAHSSSHFCFLIFHTYLSTHLPIYPLTHTPLLRTLSSPLLVHQPPANTFLQTCTREVLLLEIFTTTRDSFPFVASTAPGQDSLVGALLFFLVVFARGPPSSSPVGG